VTVEVIFLGTNGWYASPTGNTVCTLLRTGELDVVLDAGDGLHRLREFDDGRRRDTLLFLSHFHLDHLIGLHALAALPLTRLTIAGPAGSREILGRLVNEPFTVPSVRLPFPVEILELPADGARLAVPVETKPLRHAGLCLGCRLSIGGVTVAYCPDTGYCPEAVELARGVDLLITECAYRPGEDEPDWPHLTPGAAARIALEAGAGRLYLTHFDASRYPAEADRKPAEDFARKIFPGAVAAADGLRILLG
jgi:ribonuclease BN (tRNA processing enzyme)